MRTQVKFESFEGFQSQDRTVQALPLRIDYQSPRYEHFMRPAGDDWLLCFSVMKGKWNSGRRRETTNLDPYTVRDAFEAVGSAEEAARFLGESGRFWPFESVYWSQFREWQAFFRWLRLEPSKANESAEGKRAWDTAAGLGNSFFSQTDAEFSRSRFPEDAIEEIGPDRWREIQIEDRRILFHLRCFAVDPARRGEGNQVSINWYDPKDRHAQEDWKSRKGKPSKGAIFEPYLRIDALNVIEAVAATIFADRVDRRKFGKCEHCGRIFKIESDHGQKFCPAPPHLGSSPCKNAFLQHERRMNERNAIAFLLDCWSNGLGEAAIEKEAAKQGIRLTASIKQKAEAKRSKGK
jgi:hypothetical protein